MANELKIVLDPTTQAGLTVTAKVRNQACTQQGSTVNCTEPETACYIGDFDVSVLSDGVYSVEFLANSRLVGDGALYVRSAVEITADEYATYNDVIVGANA